VTRLRLSRSVLFASRASYAVRLLLALATASVVAAAPARAEVPVAAEGRVTTVTIEGTRRIEEATIWPAIGLRRGELLTSAKVRRDLKAIYGTGFFEDVRVEVVPDGEGVAVIYVVVEKPAVREVKLLGNKKIDEDDLKEVLDIEPFAVLSEAAVRANTDRIRDKYIEKGFYLAEIDPVITDVGDDQVDITFDITEGRKVVVQRVEIVGNDQLPDHKIEKFLQTKEGGIAPWLTSRGTFKKDAIQNDPYIVEEVYREEGFVDIKVDPPEIFLSPDKRFIYVQFHVNEGPKYTIGNVTADGDFVVEDGLTEQAVADVISGITVFDVQNRQWRDSLGRRIRERRETTATKVATGDPFKMSQVRGVMQSITDLYSDRGYAFVNVVPLPHTDPETKIVDLDFAIDKGDKVRIGKITITGNDPTFDKVVRREILVSEGDLYRGSLLRASKSRIERLGYFETVDISTPRGAGENELDVNVQVKEQPTGSFSAGFGFSSLESFVLTFNMSKNNFFGLGYNAAIAINWSKLRHQFNLSFSDPYFLDSRWSFTASAYSVTQQYDQDQYQRGSSVGFGRYLDYRNDVQLSFAYTFEDVGLTSIDPYKEKLAGGQIFRSGLTSSAGVTFSVDKRNNRIFATDGFYFSAATELAGGFRVSDDQVLKVIGGEFNFLESRMNLRYFQPLINDDDTLVFRVNSTAGYIASTDGSIVPYIHRFRAGGINSVRGYNWFSLGPSIRVPDSEDPQRGDKKLVVGGTSTWINNIELEAPIIRQAGILGVAFVDAGNAFGAPEGGGFINPLELRVGFGAGVRWRSPIGPLRFEYGIPVNPDPGAKKGVFDFSIGSFF
jgi:outer membrane protein insertion porin family